MFLKKKKNEYISPTGVNLAGNPKYNSGSRLVGLIAKGIAIFLIVYGCIGCFVSSIQLEYNQILVGIATFAMSMYFAVIFYKNWIKDLGLLTASAVFIYGALNLRMVINSGFYGMINVLYEKIELALDLSGVMQYGESVENRVYSVTICLLFGAAALSIIINMLVSNSMSVIRTILCTLPIAIAPSYIGLRPSSVYMIFLMTGYAIVYILKRSSHYKGNQKNEEFKVVRKNEKTSFIYHSDGKIMLQIGGFVSILALVFTFIMLQIFPYGNARVPESWKQFRSGSEKVVGGIAMMGLGGYLGFDQGTTGMSEGKLGGGSSLRSDYQTDLIVRLVPHSYEDVYLKAFVGIEYDTDSWSTETEMPQYDEYQEAYISINRELNILLNNYVRDNNAGARGKMEIQNVGANRKYKYLPYYTELSYLDNDINILNKDVFRGRSPYNAISEVEYYPYYQDKEYEMNYFNNDFSKEYLEVPQINREVIAELGEKEGFGGTEEEIIKQVIDYFEEEIPYTARPGKLPANADYVNHFLTKNKKGYCAHFASAATLIFRYYGIPARYVEGYVVPYNNIIEGDIVEGENYDEWFEGYNPLGKTAVVQVEVDDSKAHGWVEVFEKGFGWKVVDVTPSNSELLEEEMDFWSAIRDSFGGDNENATGQGIATWSLRTLTGLQMVVFIVGSIIIVYIIYKIAIYIIAAVRRKNSFNTDNYNNNLVSIYAYICYKARRKNKGFDKMFSHDMQISWLIENYEINAEEKNSLVRIMENVSYGDKIISESDYKMARGILLQTLKKV